MKGARGFTLIEVLVSMVLVSAVLAPASIWFYRKSIHAEAFNRLAALSLLEERLQDAADYPERARMGEEALPDGSVVSLKVEGFGGEVRILGTVKAKDGHVLATLQTARYLAKSGGGL